MGPDQVSTGEGTHTDLCNNEIMGQLNERPSAWRRWRMETLYENIYLLLVCQLLVAFHGLPEEQDCKWGVEAAGPDLRKCVRRGPVQEERVGLLGGLHGWKVTSTCRRKASPSEDKKFYAKGRKYAVSARGEGFMWPWSWILSSKIHNRTQRKWMKLYFLDTNKKAEEKGDYDGSRKGVHFLYPKKPQLKHPSSIHSDVEQWVGSLSGRSI